MKTPRIEFITLIAIVAAIASGADAQSGGDYALTRSLLANGDGRAGNTDYRLVGNPGQSLVGTASGGGYTLRSGYWQRQSVATPVDAIYGNGFESTPR